MTNQPRLHAAVRGLLLALMLLPCLALAAPPPSPATTPAPDPHPIVSKLAEGYGSDPAGTVAALEAIYADQAHPDERAAAGRVLLRAHLVGQQAAEAKALAAEMLAAPAGDPLGEAKLLEIDLERRYAAGDWDGLEAVEARAKAAAENTDLPVDTRADLLHDLMTVYSRVPRLPDASAVLDTTIALVGDAPSKRLLDALRAKGAIHAMQGQFPEAIEALIRAQGVVEALDLPVDTGVLQNLTGIFINLGEYDRAIEYAERAEKDQRTQSPTPANRMGVLQVLSTAHIGAGHLTEGRRWSREALAFARANGLPTGSVLNNYGHLLRDEGQFAEALAVFEELADQLDPRDPPEVRAVAEKNLGETLMRLGRHAEAAPHLQLARDLYETTDVRPKRLELYPVLIDNLEALGRHADALAAMREFKALSDETTSAESKTRIGELENTIDLERKSQDLAKAEAANELQRAENAALQARQDRARALNLALVASLVAAAAVLMLLWRTHRLRSRSHQELATRSVEIERQRNALAELNTTIAQQSREDELTGLGNRRHLLEAIANPANLEGNHLLVMLDLDHFKDINDSHGHDVGDRALQQFADTLRAAARQGDLLVRWGGEEFVWVCRGAGADQGPALCERLLRQMRQQPAVEGTSRRLTASLGYVPLPTWPDAAPDWEAALRIADYAVYCTKANGRDGWTGFVGEGSGQGLDGVSPAGMEERGALRRVASAEAAETAGAVG
ncbi:MAG: GGDEF domain-containing protein [Arenimonas sp.]|nr:GGDEF domain-containing protein [Arenimonas sp.]